MNPTVLFLLIAGVAIATARHTYDVDGDWGAPGAFLNHDMDKRSNNADTWVPYIRSSTGIRHPGSSNKYRQAFDGHLCPTGYVRIGDQCVEIH